MAFAAQNLVSDVCLRDVPFLQMPHGGTKGFDLEARDRRTGLPLAIPSDTTAKLSAVYCWGSTLLAFKVDCDVVNAELGLLHATFTSDHTTRPGIWPATLTLHSGDQLFHSQPYYVEIEPVDLYQSYGPITVGELRIHLRDTCPESNFLLDETEWSDTELATCIRWPVSIFNEVPPNITSYTVESFPFRYHWMQGAIAMAHRIAASHYRRNKLAYSAGGITIAPEDDKSKEYELIGKERMAEFQQWVADKKMELNIEQGFGHVDSSYSRIIGGW